MDCCGRNLECPKASLVSGYDLESVYDPCVCSGYNGDVHVEECSTSEVDYDMSFCIGDEEIPSVGRKLASISRPFKAMLYGGFRETKQSTISFTQYAISMEGMRAAEVFSRVRKIELFPPNVVLELLTLANQFCCDELKAACDMSLGRLVSNIDDAVLLIEYGLKEAAYPQVFLRELPSSLYKQLACHQLGVVMLERKEYKDSQRWFNSAVKAGHVYSLVGVARSKFKRGHRCSAYKTMNSLISVCSAATGWMHQERSLYRSCDEKMLDIDIAMDLDPTLTFPYKFRAVSLVEESQFGAAVAELNKILRFKVSPDCLEMRAWISIAMKNYEGALKDIRALITLEPNFLMFNKKIHGDHMVELLQPLVQRWNQADCWMQAAL
ncbi:tetratricopeptide repeat (TPR)-containing protein [Raphanus sativus]|nr:tetratricopeptide repeat (TPR)-containing protein [Raphanus sativus]